MPDSDIITTFLVNDQTDSNGFKIDWGAIKKGAADWIGKPGILFKLCNDMGCKHDHTGGNSLSEARHLSEASKVSEIIDVKLDESTHTAYAVQSVKSADFLKKLCSGHIQFVSQSIWLDKEPPDPAHIHVKASDGYTPVHLAYVDDPAYGPQAKITNAPACNMAVRSSTEDEDDDIPLLVLPYATTVIEPGSEASKVTQRFLTYLQAIGIVLTTVGALEARQPEDRVDPKSLTEVKWIRLVTKQDARTDDICRPLHNLVFAVNDPARPILPLHWGCRCKYVDESGKSLGQF